MQGYGSKKITGGLEGFTQQTPLPGLKLLILSRERRVLGDESCLQGLLGVPEDLHLPK